MPRGGPTPRRLARRGARTGEGCRFSSSYWARPVSRRQADIAVVLLDRDLGEFPARSEFDPVGIDIFAGRYRLAEHLPKLGCREFAFVTRPLAAPQ